MKHFAILAPLAVLAACADTGSWSDCDVPNQPPVAGYMKDGTPFYGDPEPMPPGARHCRDVVAPSGFDMWDDGFKYPDTPSTPDQPGTPSTPDTPSTPSTPDQPGTPDTPSAPDTPSGKEKSDNSDANGKGGNKHDRPDKDQKGSHERAEGKKGV